MNDNKRTERPMGFAAILNRKMSTSQKAPLKNDRKIIKLKMKQYLANEGNIRATTATIITVKPNSEQANKNTHTQTLTTAKTIIRRCKVRTKSTNDLYTILCLLDDLSIPFFLENLLSVEKYERDQERVLFSC